MTTIRKGQAPGPLDRIEFGRRFRNAFVDPAFRAEDDAIARLEAIAWGAYTDGRKAPRTRKAGPGYADPDYDLSVDWIAARDAIEAAQREYTDRSGPLRILLINGSSRTEHTCPGEMSKSYRLVTIADEVLRDAGIETEVLDLSRLSSEYGRNIHPCKACFSTSPALCHWPCSC